MNDDPPTVTQAVLLWVGVSVVGWSVFLGVGWYVWRLLR